MIFQGSVQEERRASSRKYYNHFILVSGFSYMFLGETVIILLAVRLDSPNYIVSTIGVMVFLGSLLPCGLIINPKNKITSYFKGLI